MTIHAEQSKASDNATPRKEFTLANPGDDVPQQLLKDNPGNESSLVHSSRRGWSGRVRFRRSRPCGKCHCQVEVGPRKQRPPTSSRLTPLSKRPSCSSALSASRRSRSFLRST